ncbi:MAG: fibronectin type III domain-containing protein, partial [Microthrixaceae bacterium]|nr:fibronectin type III domain-containing protein [Microthrixaceae bacterium]
MAIFALLPTLPAAAATTTVTAGGVYSYTEQQGPISVGSGITITNGTSYDGEYVEFAVSGSTSHDILSLLTDVTPSTASGVVSVVGNSVYLGNGTIAEPVGSVDSTFDGQAGRKLRVNFTTAFTNPGFETGDTLGWTAMKQQINLGVTSIAGFVTNDTSTYPGTAPNQDNNVPSGATWTVGPVTTGEPTEGTYALQLKSTMTTAQGCDVVHGPAAYSGEFEAAAGDKIYFDWRAFAGGDAYAVFGYIVDRNGVQTEVLDTYSTNMSNTNWATKETVIPTGGHYRFVFVAGTFDATCGQAAGASLLIDNVRVYGSKANDNVAQQIARKLQFENTSDNPAAQRTISITAKSTANGTGTGTVTVNITPVDDPMTASDPADIVYTNDAPTGETFNPISGLISVADPDTSSFDFALAGSSPASVTIGGYTYDQGVATDYGTLYINSSTGRYVFDPNSTAIDSRLTDDVDTFTVTVSAGEFSDTATITMRVDIPESVTQAPTGLSATPGQQSAELSWTPPTWIGGSSITGYHIYKSTDGSTWSTVAANTGSTDTTYT